jgi:hypothetical protein
MNDLAFICVVIALVGVIAILTFIAYYGMTSWQQTQTNGEVKHLQQILTAQQKPKVIVIYGDHVILQR